MTWFVIFAGIAAASNAYKLYPMTDAGAFSSKQTLCGLGSLGHGDLAAPTSKHWHTQL
jgi:hypothetical protein